MAEAGTHGTPCWYELGTTDLTAAAAFYGSVLGWTVTDAGMEGFDYHLATAADGVMVAGMMSTAGQQDAPPPNWLIYLACQNCDDTVAAVTAAGGSVLLPGQDVPGTGRFAVCADPQGAVFGVLDPAPMDEAPQGRAFDQDAMGHGNWHELMSSDPAAAFDFYAGLFGWTKGEALDMGEMGTYQLVEDRGRTIGGMMGLGDSPVPVWLAYFGTSSVDGAIERITAGGGSVHQGPVEVPGGAVIAVAQDPQGAWFAVVGPQAG